MKQIYEDIKGYQGRYKISNFGNVLSLKNSRGTLRNKILKPFFCGNVKCKKRIYRSVVIQLGKNKEYKRFYVSRLVWSTFNGDIPEGYEVDHIDNNPENNKLDNLQLLTRSENMKKIFIDNPDLKDYIGIKKRKQIICLNNGDTYKSISEAAKQLNLSIGNISGVLHKNRENTKGYCFQFKK